VASCGTIGLSLQSGQQLGLGAISGPLQSCGLLQIVCAATSIMTGEGSRAYDCGLHFNVCNGIRMLGPMDHTNLQLLLLLAIGHGTA
jgi:hypothetical protein